MGILLLSAPLIATKSWMVKHSFYSEDKSLTLSTINSYPHPRKLKFPRFKVQASEYGQASRRSIPATADATVQEICSKDDNLVFVAGATGKVGSRTVRELLKLGFRVRAGVRSAQRAETLLQSVQHLKLEDGASALEKFEMVECDLEKDRIEQSIDNASAVVCCIGASEKEILDVTGPYRIDYQATKNLIDAATVAGVNHFILLTSLGTNKIGFPAAILNLFWGVLIWKRKAEEALVASGIPYTIVRPGGMERPTDAYKETHNISLAKEDTLFGGQVSNLQVAELMAFMAKNREVSCCKVVEVIAETTAPRRPLEELLLRIPAHRVCESTLKDLQSERKIEAAPSQTNVPEATNSLVEKKFTRTKQPILKSSSYILYEDLNPPIVPAPTQSTFEASTRDVNVQKTEVKPASSYTQDSTKEPIKSKNASEKEIVSDNIQKLGSLSPYNAYDDLKPQTSPTPLASSATEGISNGTQAVSEPTVGSNQDNVLGSTATTSETKSTTPNVQDKRSLSPYFVYEDLKPPTSPTPVCYAQKSRSVAVKPETAAVTSSSGGSTVLDKTLTEMEEKTPPNAPTQKTSYLSPYPVYDDWKPPASPSPSAPLTVPFLSSSTEDAGSLLSSKSDVSIAQEATPDEVEYKQHFGELKARPLSPFAMYEDLKPPSSPMPCPNKC